MSGMASSPFRQLSQILMHFKLHAADLRQKPRCRHAVVDWIGLDPDARLGPEIAEPVPAWLPTPGHSRSWRVRVDGDGGRSANPPAAARSVRWGLGRAIDQRPPAHLDRPRRLPSQCRWRQIPPVFCFHKRADVALIDRVATSREFVLAVTGLRCRHDFLDWLNPEALNATGFLLYSFRGSCWQR